MNKHKQVYLKHLLKEDARQKREHTNQLKPKAEVKI